MAEVERERRVPLMVIDEVRAGVDWLTITAKSEPFQKELWGVAVAIKDELLTKGEHLHPWKFKGYGGFLVGSVRFGSRDDSCIVMVSGFDAARWWDTFGVLAENCTRIDLAVTVTLEEPYTGLAEVYYRWFDLCGPPMSMPKLQCSLVKNTNGGQTLYVGRRKSNQFGRVYDWAAAHNEPDLIARIWRYEVEYKDRMALAVLSKLLDRGELTPPMVINDVVWHWFDKREVPPVHACGWAAAEVDLEARVSSDDLSLAWLTTQVSPTVKRLVHSGRLAETVEALGLGRYATFYEAFQELRHEEVEAVFSS